MNAILSRTWVSGVFLLTILLFSCRSETDEVEPSILIHSPNQGRSYQAGDTISLSATFSDDEQLLSVKVVLIDDEGKPVLTPYEVISPPNPYQLNLEYPVHDLSLASGTYELQFQAQDETNLTNVFLPILLSELPREFLYPLLVTRPTNHTVNIFSLESDQQVKKILSRQGDYTGAAINPLAKTLYVCGAYQSDLTAFSLEDLQENWSIPPKQNIHNRWFESVSYQHPVLCVAYYEGYVRGIDPNGMTIFTTLASGNNFPEYAILTTDYVIAGLKEYGSNTHSIAWYHQPGGTLRQLLSPTPAIVGIQPLDDQKFLTFGNWQGKGSIGLLNILSGTHSIIRELTNDSITGVDAMDPDNIIFTCKKSVYWYRYSQNSLSEYVKDIEEPRVRCETEGRIVFISSKNKIHSFSFPDGILLQSLSLDEPIADILLLYNK